MDILDNLYFWGGGLGLGGGGGGGGLVLMEKKGWMPTNCLLADGGGGGGGGGLVLMEKKGWMPTNCLLPHNAFNSLPCLYIVVPCFFTLQVYAM